MKRIILVFAVCLGLSVSQTTFAVVANASGGASKRTSANVVSLARGANQSTKSTRTTVTQPNQRVSVRTVNQNVKSRATTNRTTKNVSPRAGTAVRGALQSRIVNSAASRATNSTTNRQRATRTKELNVEKMAEIKAADYSQCKSVYYECMDEFCAMKDANLRRCACSARIHEFDNIKKQLSAAEDKMLDFNQRLLTVGLEKEDAAAINVASEGELAFNKKDSSKSEKYLKKIQKTLDSSGDSRFDNDLSTISLSLDIDSAWADVDSLAGVATTTKSGLDLYNAARPICVEMAQEVCTEDELKIAQDGYKLTIQQDCNTVAKSYNTLYNDTMEKIHESSALLDMARLDSYQQHNSDDTLTCKKKILEKLSETSVCGENLYKCLDMTGQYIDPSTGKAFLSENLNDLADLLKEPTGNTKWSELSQNEPFVNFLKSKKRFLTTATEQCREISDTIWREFLDDALAQIKLAQRAKLEEVRRGCTTLYSECKTSALKDLAEFDARALSVFKVNANKTADEMCADIKNSCVAVMGASDVGKDWGTGMAGITTDMSYDAIIDTCTQIGRDCIIQKCNGTSGNFALCMNTTSDNRIAILKRDACWGDVLNCVKNSNNLEDMNKGILKSFNPDNPDASRRAYYESLYTNLAYSTMPTMCNSNNEDYMACLIAEQIWGNCENDNNNSIITNLTNLPANISYVKSNRILIPKKGSTLMSWFATNTGTTNNLDSCNTYACPVNYQNNNGACSLLIDDTTNDCYIATNKNQKVAVVKDTLFNFCADGVRDAFGNCCANGHKSNGICVKSENLYALRFLSTTCNTNDPYFCPNYDETNPRQIYYYCISPNNQIDFDGTSYNCAGDWIAVDQYGNYFNIASSATTTINNTPIYSTLDFAPTMSYQKCTPCNTEEEQVCTTCTYTYDQGWSFGSCQDDIGEGVPTSNEFIIEYSD